MSRLIPQLLGPDAFPTLPIIERAHRSPTARQNSRASPRAIMIELLNFQDKVKILRLAREKKSLDYNGKHISIYPDFSPELTRRRQSFDPVKRKLRELNLKYFLMVSALEEEVGELEQAKKELETWKTKAEKADDVKARLILEKLKEDEAKDKAMKECLACVEKEKDCDFTQSMKAVQEEILNLGNRRQNLLDKLKRFQTELEAKRAESTKLKHKFKIYAQIPDTEVNYRTQYEEQMGDGSQPISGRYLISQRASVHLQGGQALITFEEEKVASQILKIPKCSVSCEHSSVDVKPRGITMDPAVKFEENVIVPALPAISDDDEEEDDNAADPDFVPPTHNLDIPGPSDMGTSGKRKRMHPAVLQVEENVMTTTATTSSQHHKTRGPPNPGSQQQGQPPGTKLNWTTQHCLNTSTPPPDYIETHVQYFTSVSQQTQCSVVILNVSRKEVKVHNIPTSMPEDRMIDRLGLSFCKPSRGGGEVERVKYDKNTGSGQITFLHPGVADGLALRGRYRLDLDSEVNVQVGPVYSYQLFSFQTFCGSPKRTVLLEDIEDKEEEEDLQDHLEIHFQKPSNYGGEIESIRYLSGGKALQAFFCEDPL
ncbi:hypothetical protein JOQ06_029761 [Pogonophryne albipinna]|uniref:NID domain-containing protein n=1 Tax=Pogonophryne albipinna TaxID=1090488 RepID=A0AAD6FGF5_9TELE|nr:hypothetical protein JOQ06_029761 [Pogonophryne albipinna]